MRLSLSVITSASYKTIGGFGKEDENFIHYGLKLCTNEKLVANEEVNVRRNCHSLNQQKGPIMKNLGISV